MPSEIVTQDAATQMESQTRLSEVETLLGQLATAERQLETGYGKLAYLLKDVSDNRYWVGHYISWGEYLEYLADRYRIGRAQLYSYLGAARDLEGDASEADLTQMGIEKAKVLRKVKNTTNTLPENALKNALDPKVTVKDLKRLLFTAANIQEESGEWMDLNFQFFVTPEERATLQDAINAAIHTDPVIQNTLPEPVRMKEIALRFAQEYLASHAESVVE